MGKRILILVGLLSLVVVLMGQPALSDQRLSLGGELVGSTPQVVGAYRWDNVGLKAGLGIQSSEPVFSTDARYYFTFLKNLATEAYLGAGVLYAEGGSSGPGPPPPPPDSDTATTSTDGDSGGNTLMAT